MDFGHDQPRASRIALVFLWVLALGTFGVLLQDVSGLPFGREVRLKVLPSTVNNPEVVRLSISGLVPNDVQLRRQMRIWEGRRKLVGPYRSLSLARESGPGNFTIGKVVMVLPHSSRSDEGAEEYLAWIPRSVPSWLRWPVYLAFIVSILVPAVRRYFRDHPLKEGKLLHLEALRGLACFIVVLNHFTNLFYPHLSVEDVASKKWYEPESLYHWIPFASLVNSGAFAVNTFFVLSGFVLYLPFCGAGADRGMKLGLASIRRPVRLYGILAAVMLVSYLLRVGGWPFGGFYSPPKPLAGFLYDWLTAYNSSTSYNNAFWTIRYELIGSLGVYAFAFILGWTRWRWVGYLIALIALHETLYADFVLGMMLADCVKSHPGFKMPARYRYFSAVLLILGLVAGLCSIEPDRMTSGVIWLVGMLPDPRVMVKGGYGTIGAVLVIAAVLLSPAMQRALSLRCLTVLGRLSYSTYGIHGLILGTCVTWWMFRLHPSVENAKFSFEPDGWSYHTSAGTSFVFYLVLVFVFSSALTAFVDEPCVRFSKRILGNLQKRTGKTPDKISSGGLPG